jgi:flavodoxin
MKTLVACYSRTGYTKKVGQAIAGKISADFEEIIDLTDRRGSRGWLNASRDATFKRKTAIKPLEKNPADYDLVIIGTPVWAWTMTPAVRTYIEQNRGRFNRVAFYCTMGINGGERTISAMAKLIGKEPRPALIVLTREAGQNSGEKKINEFIAEL